MDHPDLILIGSHLNVRSNKGTIDFIFFSINYDPLHLTLEIV